MSDKKTIYEVMEAFQRASAAMQEGFSAVRKQFDVLAVEVDKVIDDIGRSLLELVADAEMKEEPPITEFMVGNTLQELLQVDFAAAQRWHDTISESAYEAGVDDHALAIAIADQVMRNCFSVQMQEISSVKEPKRSKTKYFIDTEFIEDGKTIELISIAIICEDGRELYLENLDCNLSNASKWVNENVLPQLWAAKLKVLPGTQRYCWMDDDSITNLGTSLAWRRLGYATQGGAIRHSKMANAIAEFCSPSMHGTPEFWADYASYDWLALCQVFGTMMDLPKDFPQYCHDIRQECDRMGNPPLPAQEGRAHHALADARYCKLLHECLAF